MSANSFTKRRAPRYGKSGLFSGVAYCADCGAKLYFYSRSIKNKWGTRYEGSYSCSEYRKDVQYQGKPVGTACVRGIAGFTPLHSQA
jgi:hypothetical protein